MTTVNPAFIAPTLDIHLSDVDLRNALEHDVRTGLTANPKRLPPVYFYDDRGSRLFDQITRLPEYYPTRSERWILDTHAKDMALLRMPTPLSSWGPVPARSPGSFSMPCRPPVVWPVTFPST